MSYRTSVLYDFSVVTKANFYILKLDDASLFSLPSISLDFTKTKKFPFKFKYVKGPLPVQINPEQIRFDHGKDKIRVEDASFQGIPCDKAGPLPIAKHPTYDGRDSMSISLKYDLYDEYMARTNNDLIWSDEVSLLNENATTLKILTQYAGRRNYYVLFIWGDIEYFGILSGVDGEYDAFSRYGVPLKANCTVHIDKQPLAYDEDDGTEISPLESGQINTLAKTLIEVSQLASKSLTLAETAVVEAAKFGTGLGVYLANRN